MDWDVAKQVFNKPERVHLVSIEGFEDTGKSTLTDALLSDYAFMTGAKAKVEIEVPFAHSQQVKAISSNVMIATMVSQLEDQEKPLCQTVETIHMEVSIIECCSRIDSTMVFRNPYFQPLEAVFFFPMNEKAAICGFEAQIGEKRIIGQIQTKEKAFNMYSDAISEGHGAYLLEQESPTLIKACIGNLPPNSCVTIKLQYVMELPLAIDRTVFFLPIYNNSGKNSNLIVETKDLKIAHYALSMNIKIQMHTPIESIESNFQNICQFSIHENFAEVSYANSYDLKDFMLTIKQKDPFSLRCCIEENLEDSNSKSALIAFYPKFEKNELEIHSDFQFIIDRSGSMSGSRIQSAGTALAELLKILPPKNCTFNIIGFGSEFKTLFKESVPTTKGNIQTALLHAQNMKADLGGTELKGPLTHAFKLTLPKGFSRQLFIITDGEVSNTNELVELVYNEASTTRVFTFGLWTFVDIFNAHLGIESAGKQLIESLATVGNGKFEFVNSSNLQTIVKSQLEKAMEPSITNLELDWGDFKVDTVAPRKISPIFNGSRMLVFANFNSKEITCKEGIVKLKGIVGGGSQMTWETKMNFSDVQSKGNVIQTLTAKSLIREYERNYGREFSNVVIQQKVTELGLKFHLASSFTSFVAIEKREDKIKESSKIEYVVPPNPKGGTLAEVAHSYRFTDTRQDEEPRHVIPMREANPPLIFKEGKIISVVELIKLHPDRFRHIAFDGVVIVIDATTPDKIPNLLPFVSKKIKMCLFINKIDILFLEGISNEEIFKRINTIIQNANNQLDPTSNIYFDPAENVAFGSGMSGYAFTVKHFIKILKNMKGINLTPFSLWNYYFDSNRKRLSAIPIGEKPVHAFAHIVLGALRKIYEVTEISEYDAIIRKLNLNIKVSGVLTISPLKIAKMILREWISVSSLMSMIVHVLPSSKEAQSYRYDVLVDSDHPASKWIKECSLQNPLVFFSTVNPTVTQYCFGRIFSGTLEIGASVSVVTPDGIQNKRIQDIYLPRDRKVPSLFAGNCCALRVPFGKLPLIITTDDKITSPNNLISSHPKLVMSLKSNPQYFYNNETKSLCTSLGVEMRALDTDYHFVAEIERLKALAKEMQLKTKMTFVKQFYLQDAETVDSVTPICVAESPNKHNRIYLQLFPIPQDLTNKWNEIKGLDFQHKKKILIEYGFESETLANILMETFDEAGLSLISISEKSIQSFPKWIELKDSICSAFSWMSVNGPIADDPVRDVLVVVQDITAISDTIHRGGGQIIPTVRNGIFFLLQLKPRIKKQLFDATITCHPSVLCELEELLGKEGAIIRDISTIVGGIRLQVLLNAKSYLLLCDIEEKIPLQIDNIVRCFEIETPKQEEIIEKRRFKGLPEAENIIRGRVWLLSEQK